MKILVCIKQVPDMESRFRINGEGTWIVEDELAWRMNEYDEYAVEQAILLKTQVGEADITVLSIGPDRVRDAVKKALAMGCDRGVQVRDVRSFEKDPLQIASIIARFARDKGFDVIFTGMQSQDRGSGQVGVLAAEMLGLPVVTTVVDFAWSGGEISAKRELEGGLRAAVRVRAPAVVTCQLGLNVPRYPTLPNIMKAKKKELLTIGVEELLGTGGVAPTTGMFFPERKAGGLVLEGEPDQLANQVLKILKEKTGVPA